jgi:GGDEF domain-containing protein
VFGPRVLQTVTLELAPQLPGSVALIDIADCKRRNLLLGFERVDRDIAELDRLVRGWLGGASAGCRIAGDQWLLVGQLDTGNLQTLLTDFDRAETSCIEQVRRARRRDEPWQSDVERRSISIRRALRCLYAPDPVATLEELLSVAARLQEGIARAPVGRVAMRVEANASPTPESRWCSAEDIDFELRCPLCQSLALDVTGGADDATEATCTQCGAELDFVLHAKSGG